MKWFSKIDAEEVRHCQTKKEMIDKLECLYGEDCNVSQEKVEEPCCSSSEPKHVVVSNKKKRKKKGKASKRKYS